MLNNLTFNNPTPCFSLPLMRAPLALAIAATFAAPSFAQTGESDTPEPEPEMEIMVVTADFRRASLEKMPSSITVIDAQQIQDESAQHFEDVLNGIANFNWSGGSSRPKYFQIRG
ncbi:MAG: TonB-dependent receptor plug domain-containing protein, partial [Shewanella sp.]